MKSHDWIFLMFTTIICCTTTIAQAQRGRVRFSSPVQKEDVGTNVNPKDTSLSNQARGSSPLRASSRFRGAPSAAIPSTIDENKDESSRPVQRASRGRMNDRSSRKLTAEATEAIPLVRSRKRVNPVAPNSDEPTKIEIPTSSSLSSLPSVDRTNVIRRSKTRSASQSTSAPLPSPANIRRRSDAPPSDISTESNRKVRNFTSRSSVTKQVDDVISSENPLTVATTGSSWRNVALKRGTSKSKPSARKSKALEEDQLEDENYPEHFKLLLRKQQPGPALLPKNYPKIPIQEEQTYPKLNEVYEAPKTQGRLRRLEQQNSQETSDEILQVSRAIPSVRRVELKREDTSRAALKTKRIESRVEENKENAFKIEQSSKSRRSDAEKLRTQVKINKPVIKPRKKDPPIGEQREDIPKVPTKPSRRSESTSESAPEIKPNEIEEATKATKPLFLPRRAEPYRPKPKTTTTERPTTTSKPIKKPEVLAARAKFKNRLSSRLQFPSLRSKSSDEALKFDNEVVQTSPVPQQVRPLQITKSRNLAMDRPAVEARLKPKQQKFSSRYRGDAFSRYQQKTEPSKPIYTPTIPVLTTEPMPPQIDQVTPYSIEIRDLNKSNGNLDGIVFDGAAGAWNMIEPVAGGLTRSEISVESGDQPQPQSSVTVSIFEALADILSKTPSTTTTTTTTTTTSTTTSTTELPDIIQVPDQKTVSNKTSTTVNTSHNPITDVMDGENPTTTNAITNKDRNYGRLLNSVEINPTTTNINPTTNLPNDPITVPQNTISNTTLLRFSSQTEQTNSGLTDFTTISLPASPTQPSLINTNLTNISTNLLELTTLASNPPTSLPMPFLADALTTPGSSLITTPQLISAINNFLDTSVQNASETMATTTEPSTTSTQETNSTPTDASTTLSPPLTTTLSPTSTELPPVTISFLDLFTIQAKKVNQNTEPAMEVHPIYIGPESTTTPEGLDNQQTTGQPVNINKFFGIQSYPSTMVTGSTLSTDSSTFPGTFKVTGGETTDTAIPSTSTTLEQDTSTFDYTTSPQSSTRTQSLPIHLNSILGSTQKYDQTSPFKTVQTEITTTIRSRFGNRRIPILPVGTVQSKTNKISTSTQTSSTTTSTNTPVSTTSTTAVTPMSPENNENQLLNETTTTEQKLIQDFSVYGILPNNTVIRKRPPQVSRQLDIGIMVYGILPNQTLVRKYPNGTLMIVDSSKDIEVVDIDPKMLFNPFSELYRTSQSSLLLTTHRSTTSHRLIESNHIISSSSSSSTEVPNSIKETTESGNTDSTLVTNTDDENLIQWLSENEDNILNSTILVESNTENAVLLDLLKRKYIKSDLPSKSSNVVSLTTIKNVVEENSIPANKEEDVSENTLFDSSEENKKTSIDDLFLSKGSVLPNRNNNNDDENVISKQFDTSFANAGTIGSIFGGTKGRKIDNISQRTKLYPINNYEMNIPNTTTKLIPIHTFSSSTMHKDNHALQKELFIAEVMNHTHDGKVIENPIDGLAVTIPKREGESKFIDFGILESEVDSEANSDYFMDPEDRLKVIDDGLLDFDTEEGSGDDDGVFKDIESLGDSETNKGVDERKTQNMNFSLGGNREESNAGEVTTTILNDSDNENKQSPFVHIVFPEGNLESSEKFSDIYSTMSPFRNKSSLFQSENLLPSTNLNSSLEKDSGDMEAQTISTTTSSYQDDRFSAEDFSESLNSSKNLSNSLESNIKNETLDLPEDKYREVSNETVAGFQNNVSQLSTNSEDFFDSESKIPDDLDSTHSNGNSSKQPTLNSFESINSSDAQNIVFSKNSDYNSSIKISEPDTIFNSNNTNASGIGYSEDSNLGFHHNIQNNTLASETSFTVSKLQNNIFDNDLKQRQEHISFPLSFDNIENISSQNETIILEDHSNSDKNINLYDLVSLNNSSLLSPNLDSEILETNSSVSTANVESSFAENLNSENVSSTQKTISFGSEDENESSNDVISYEKVKGTLEPAGDLDSVKDNRVFGQLENEDIKNPIESLDPVINLTTESNDSILPVVVSNTNAELLDDFGNPSEILNNQSIIIKDPGEYDSTGSPFIREDTVSQTFNLDLHTSDNVSNTSEASTFDAKKVQNENQTFEDSERKTDFEVKTRVPENNENIIREESLDKNFTTESNNNLSVSREEFFTSHDWSSNVNKIDPYNITMPLKPIEIGTLTEELSSTISSTESVKNIEQYSTVSIGEGNSFNQVIDRENIQKSNNSDTEISGILNSYINDPSISQMEPLQEFNKTEEISFKVSSNSSVNVSNISSLSNIDNLTHNLSNGKDITLNEVESANGIHSEILGVDNISTTDPPPKIDVLNAILSNSSVTFNPDNKESFLDSKANISNSFLNHNVSSDTPESSDSYYKDEKFNEVSNIFKNESSVISTSFGIEDEQFNNETVLEIQNLKKPSSEDLMKHDNGFEIETLTLNGENAGIVSKDITDSTIGTQPTRVEEILQLQNETIAGELQIRVTNSSQNISLKIDGTSQNTSTVSPNNNEQPRETELLKVSQSEYPGIVHSEIIQKNISEISEQSYSPNLTKETINQRFENTQNNEHNDTSSKNVWFSSISSEIIEKDSLPNIQPQESTAEKFKETKEILSLLLNETKANSSDSETDQNLATKVPFSQNTQIDNSNLSTNTQFNNENRTVSQFDSVSEIGQELAEVSRPIFLDPIVRTLNTSFGSGSTDIALETEQHVVPRKGVVINSTEELVFNSTTKLKDTPFENSTTITFSEAAKNIDEKPESVFSNNGSENENLILNNFSQDNFNESLHSFNQIKAGDVKNSNTQENSKVAKDSSNSDFSSSLTETDISSSTTQEPYLDSVLESSTPKNIKEEEILFENLKAQENDSKDQPIFNSVEKSVKLLTASSTQTPIPQEQQIETSSVRTAPSKSDKDRVSKIILEVLNRYEQSKRNISESSTNLPVENSQNNLVTPNTPFDATDLSTSNNKGRVNIKVISATADDSEKIQVFDQNVETVSEDSKNAIISIKSDSHTTQNPFDKSSLSPTYYSVTENYEEITKPPALFYPVNSPKSVTPLSNLKPAIVMPTNMHVVFETSTEPAKVSMIFPKDAMPTLNMALPGNLHQKYTKERLHKPLLSIISSSDTTPKQESSTKKKSNQMKSPKEREFNYPLKPIYPPSYFEESSRDRTTSIPTVILPRDKGEKSPLFVPGGIPIELMPKSDNFLVPTRPTYQTVLPSENKFVPGGVPRDLLENLGPLPKKHYQVVPIFNADTPLSEVFKHFPSNNVLPHNKPTSAPVPIENTDNVFHKTYQYNLKILKSTIEKVENDVKVLKETFIKNLNKTSNVTNSERERIEGQNKSDDFKSESPPADLSTALESVSNDSKLNLQTLMKNSEFKPSNSNSAYQMSPNALANAQTINSFMSESVSKLNPGVSNDSNQNQYEPTPFGKTPQQFSSEDSWTKLTPSEGPFSLVQNNEAHNQIHTDTQNTLKPQQHIYQESISISSLGNSFVNDNLKNSIAEPNQNDRKTTPTIYVVTPAPKMTTTSELPTTTSTTTTPSTTSTTTTTTTSTTPSTTTTSSTTESTTTSTTTTTTSTTPIPIVVEAETTPRPTIVFKAPSTTSSTIINSEAPQQANAVLTGPNSELEKNIKLLEQLLKLQASLQPKPSSSSSTTTTTTTTPVSTTIKSKAGVVPNVNDEQFLNQLRQLLLTQQQAAKKISTTTPTTTTTTTTTNKPITISPQNLQDLLNSFSTPTFTSTTPKPVPFTNDVDFLNSLRDIGKIQVTTSAPTTFANRIIELALKNRTVKPTSPVYISTTVPPFVPMPEVNIPQILPSNEIEKHREDQASLSADLSLLSTLLGKRITVADLPQITQQFGANRGKPAPAPVPRKPLTSTPRTTRRTTTTTTTERPMTRDEIAEIEKNLNLLSSLLGRPVSLSELPLIMQELRAGRTPKGSAASGATINFISPTSFKTTTTLRPKPTLKAPISQEEVIELLKDPSVGSPEQLNVYGQTNDAILAAVLKQRGIGPAHNNLPINDLFNADQTPRPYRPPRPTPPPPPPRRPVLDGLAWLWRTWQETAAPGNRVSKSNRQPTASASTRLESPLLVGAFGDEAPTPTVNSNEGGEYADLQYPQNPSFGEGNGLLTAAFGVTRAVTQFLGAAFQGAAKSVQSAFSPQAIQQPSLISLSG